jgi:hypothetical protein
MRSFSLREGLPTITCDRGARELMPGSIIGGRQFQSLADARPVWVRSTHRPSTSTRSRLLCDGQLHRLCQAELKQRFAGNRDLLPLLGSGDSRSRAGTGEHSNPGSLSPSR